MKMKNRFRIYGKTLNIWYSENERGRKTLSQIELPYKEYDSDGNLVATGSEDFSADRYENIDIKFVWSWDGQKRNKGGYRWFDFHGSISYQHKDARLVKLYLKAKYNAEVIDLR